MTTRAMTSDRWNGSEWIQVVSMIEVPAPRDEAADRAEYLAGCSPEERTEAEEFFAAAGVCRHCHNGNDVCSCP